MRTRRIGEAARELGVSAMTLRRLEKAGKANLGRDWRGRRVFSDEDLAQLRQLLYPTQSRAVARP
jgi:DNA-binding transcriptional MerR regulator